MQLRHKRINHSLLRDSYGDIVSLLRYFDSMLCLAGPGDKLYFYWLSTKLTRLSFPNVILPRGDEVN